MGPPLRAVCLVALASVLALLATRARADVDQALADLDAHIQEPANCGLGAGLCEKAFPAAGKILGTARALVQRGEVAKGLAQAARAVQKLEKSALAVGTVGSLVEGLVGAADTDVDGSRSGAETGASALCSSRRLPLEKRLRKADGVLADARSHRDLAEFALALKRLAKASRSYSSSADKAAAAAPRCLAKPCKDSHLAVFTPGDANGPSLVLIRPDKGTHACYDVTLTSGADMLSADVCLDYRRLASFVVSGRVTITDFGSANVRGRQTAQSCTDDAGVGRVLRFNEQLRAFEGGRSGTAVSRLFFDQPIAGGIFSNIWPFYPLPREAREGDRIAETLVTNAQSLGVRIESVCSNAVEVLGIEPVVLPGGTFTAAVLIQELSCSESRSDGTQSDFVVVSKTWIASEVGILRVEWTRESDFPGSYFAELTAFQRPELP